MYEYRPIFAVAKHLGNLDAAKTLPAGERAQTPERALQREQRKTGISAGE
jgi:hypothetical protein